MRFSVLQLLCPQIPDLERGFDSNQKNKGMQKKTLARKQALNAKLAKSATVQNVS